MVGRQEEHLARKKTQWWAAGIVICLERAADLHTAQVMPLPLTVSCFSKIQIGFTFLVPAHTLSGCMYVCTHPVLSSKHCIELKLLTPSSQGKNHHPLVSSTVDPKLPHPFDTMAGAISIKQCQIYLKNFERKQICYSSVNHNFHSTFSSVHSTD